MRSGAAARAEALRASRVHELKLAMGHEDEESIEAEVGALLQAETAAEIHDIHSMIESYLEAMRSAT